MEVILKTNIEKLGAKDEVVKVRPGYARNYLIPRGYAISATESARKVLSENLKQRAHKETKILADAQALAEKLNGLELKIGTKASDTGKIFGSSKFLRHWAKPVTRLIARASVCPMIISRP